MSHERRVQAVTVFCGSRDGTRASYRSAATAFGAAMARRGLDLVYGGAQNGLMGAVADAVVNGGRAVVGVIPAGLDRVEFAHPRLSERIDVDTMHARKAVMAERADAFVALPGGFGTMDELFEALTWRQLAMHDKPLGLLDVDDYYRPLVAFLDGAVREGFAPARVRALLVVESDPDVLLARLEEAR
ncbi:MAG: TIGR00730 family Rossman fold protein [Myxococcaceae bacterium]|nr:TIGR00730 family Rossman fold protein [Myxococcaceae bacterium]